MKKKKEKVELLECFKDWFMTVKEYINWNEAKKTVLIKSNATKFLKKEDFWNDKGIRRNGNITLYQQKSCIYILIYYYLYIVYTYLKLTPPQGGLINDLVSKGYGDVTFKIGDTEIVSIKNLLLYQNNNYLTTLINNAFDKRSNIFLSEGITVNGFKMLMVYYGYGNVEVNSDNICDLLVTSYLIKDYTLFKQCKEYIIYIYIYYC